MKTDTMSQLMVNIHNSMLDPQYTIFYQIGDSEREGLLNRVLAHKDREHITLEYNPQTKYIKVLGQQENDVIQRKGKIYIQWKVDELVSILYDFEKTTIETLKKFILRQIRTVQIDNSAEMALNEIKQVFE